MLKFCVENEKALVRAPYDERFVEVAKREMGGKWNPQKKAWVFPADSDAMERLKEKLRQIYGVDVEKPVSWARLRYFSDDNEPFEALRAPAVVGGAEVAIVRGRDSGAWTGEGVFLLEGKIDSGGSMKNWKSQVFPGAVFKALIYADSDIPRGWEVEYLDDEVRWDDTTPLCEEERVGNKEEAVESLSREEIRRRGEAALSELTRLARDAMGLGDDWVEIFERKVSFYERAKEVVWIEFLAGGAFPADKKEDLRRAVEYIREHGEL